MPIHLQAFKSWFEEWIESSVITSSVIVGVDARTELKMLKLPNIPIYVTFKVMLGNYSKKKKKNGNAVYISSGGHILTVIE